MYVGITRAQRGLTLTYCVKRRRGGEWLFVEPSRFIAEISGDDLRHFGKKGAEPIVSKNEGKSRLAGLMASLDNKVQKGGDGA